MADHRDVNLLKKCLSPEDITKCLKSVERYNGLSQLAQRTSEHLTTLETSFFNFGSLVKLLSLVFKKYGFVTLLLLLLSYSSVQLKTRNTQQLLLRHECDKTQRRKRRNLRVAALLAVIKDQQIQYNQIAMLVGARVAKYLAARKATHWTKVNTFTTMSTRNSELQALRSELMKIKGVVVDTCSQLQINSRLKKPKEIVKTLEPASASGTGIEVDHNEAISISIAREGERIATQNHIRDQTTMSHEELTELFKSGQAKEELSTPGSFWVFFAS
ncbi:uncharacterized protein PHALS_06785 [Plasmopara halstedii]|uniref:Uncharacterized protein n=1 Tax=Plasmopara halstedii TaxID=4781 RepID=A0A0N7L863_PLAHL|nr:uncharacterized protein PHALS_06785 [Plasmopara halstedii]CEG48995.1 hypothetical protein PHALS_06785 [Plasmopara halstedii]|eukprot:XP_024585364.1 hypothetical protein PHALS_06785 [Plasmopara halstedii]